MYCEICGEFKLTDWHKCQPLWYVWDEDSWDEKEQDIDDTLIVRGYDAQEAATEAAVKWDNEYGEGPTKHILFVKKYGSDSMTSFKKFHVCFDYSVDYSATEAE